VGEHTVVKRGACGLCQCQGLQCRTPCVSTDVLCAPRVRSAAEICQDTNRHPSSGSHGL
jgi:hypothetical protein